MLLAGGSLAEHAPRFFTQSCSAACIIARGYSFPRLCMSCWISYGPCQPILLVCLGTFVWQCCPRVCWLFHPIWCHLQTWWACNFGESLPKRIEKKTNQVSDRLLCYCIVIMFATFWTWWSMLTPLVVHPSRLTSILLCWVFSDSVDKPCYNQGKWYPLFSSGLQIKLFYCRQNPRWSGIIYIW